jgi:hypothetical protein
VLIELGLVEISLLAAAVLVGATGTWSPCGFSMIETIGPAGHTGGRWVTPAACATFLPGAVAGAVITFGGLALAGSALPGGWLAYVVAAAVALVAAIAEARGSRIAPQIRRQLPEHWRRVMPMPLAAALYGVLLGLGFTTFVLTFGVWALAGISLALGEPAIGFAIGLGFGVGRALPIVVLAPIADRPAGRSAVALMADRPGLYRGIRLGDAVALALAAVTLFGAAGAEAVVKRAKPAADPAVEGRDFVSQRGESRAAELRRGAGGATQLPGTDPAVGGAYIAVLNGGNVRLLARNTLEDVDGVEVPGADAVAVSGAWLAVRSRLDRRDRLEVRPIAPDGTIGQAIEVAAAGPPAQIGRPSVGGDRVAYAVAKSNKNKIAIFQAGKRKRRTVLASRKRSLSNPSIRGHSLLYVRSKRRGRHELRLRKLKKHGGDHLLKASGDRMWSTALSGKRAYVTILAGRRPVGRVISVKR